MRRWLLTSPDIIARCAATVGRLDVGGVVKEVTLKDYEPPRTLAANALYWAAIVTPMAESFGYQKAEMHEVLLAEHFGVHDVGKLRLPRKRSSSLTRREMNNYIEWCAQFAAEQGVILGI